jgi:PAS domain S-box-containing protein
MRRGLSSLLGSRLALLAGSAAFLAGFIFVVAALRNQGNSPSAVLAWLAAGGLLASLGFAAVAVVAGRGWRDVAASRALARELEASEQLFGRILEIAADAIISIDAEQRILHFNKGAEEIFGWRADEVLGKPLSLLIPERFQVAHRRHVEEFRHASESSRRMGERREIYGRRRDGTEFPAEASISRVELPERVVFTVVLRDITARKQAEEDERFLARAGVALSATLDFESTLRTAVHVAVPYLADCCVLDVADPGPALRRIASVHEDADITRRLKALETARVASGHWPFPVTAAMARGVAIVRDRLGDEWVREGGPGDEVEQLVASLGIRSLMTVPLAARGHTIGALTLLITDPGRSFSEDRRRVAMSLANVIALSIENAALYRAAQRASVARDEILGVVSHDLRNPLSAITMCARVLLESPPEEEEARRELLSAVLESSRMMQRLIQDLLDVAVIESGHLTIHRRPEQLDAIVQQALAMVQAAAEERGIHLTAAVPQAMPPIDVDATRLVQVLVNLLGNAIKFTEPGGKVSVGAEAGEGSAVVWVSDTGVGIPQEDLPHIFDRFWHSRRNASAAGAGLGLAIARGIVEAHGGRIWVESVVKEGSTFFFTVPIAAAAAPEVSAALASRTAS